ncbi:MAG TPA: hypothetical protein VE693_11485 [Gaiellaceae bacterium]|nr:hypothetical protein [Gaiellaceae bacterium]
MTGSVVVGAETLGAESTGSGGGDTVVDVVPSTTGSEAVPAWTRGSLIFHTPRNALANMDKILKPAPAAAHPSAVD